jgi:hypothetical protein
MLKGSSLLCLDRGSSKLRICCQRKNSCVYGCQSSSLLVPSCQGLWAEAVTELGTGTQICPDLWSSKDNESSLASSYLQNASVPDSADYTTMSPTSRHRAGCCLLATSALGQLCLSLENWTFPQTEVQLASTQHPACMDLKCCWELPSERCSALSTSEPGGG